MTEQTRTVTIPICEHEEFKKDRERLDDLENALKVEHVTYISAANYSEEEGRWTEIVVEFTDSDYRTAGIREAIDRIGDECEAIDKAREQG